MKTFTFLTLVILLFSSAVFAQVGINTDNTQPDASAGLDVKFSNKGFLMPRMTFEQRNAIASPAEGLMVYCTNCGTNGALSIYSDGAWRVLFPCITPVSTTAVHTILPGQIVWHWNLPAGVSGSKWNTSNNYETAIDMGITTSKAESGIACDTTYTRFVWSYNNCGNSAPLILSQSIPTAPTAPTEYITNYSFNRIWWQWLSVPGATGYKWSATNDYATATDMGGQDFFPESGLSCSTSYTRYVWAYSSCGHSEPLVTVHSTMACFHCGVPFVKVHLSSEGVAPVNKSVTYSSAMGVAGEPEKCWLTRNLGASQQATAVDDATEASAGWYWKFNSKRGYKQDGLIFPPWTGSGDYEPADWYPNNDPCSLELGSLWRLPTETEWFNLDLGGIWTNWTGPFNSVLKIHAAGIIFKEGILYGRGSDGGYWSSTKEVGSYNLFAMKFYISSSDAGVGEGDKGHGNSVRCIFSMDSSPDVSTATLTGINQTTATGGGNVTSNGGHYVSARGVCWSTSPNPTIADSKTSDGQGTGSFTSNLTGLSISTLYYVRAYATNSAGTSYGDQVSFTTLSYVLGQSFGGGKIFYIDGTGQHGFIAATSDQGYPSPGDVITWGCRPQSIPGTLTAIGTGAANTELIVANGCNNPSYAARVCNDLVLNGYDDWFLPSKDELNQLYLQRALIGGFANSYYWCSTEMNADYAYIQFLGSGGTQTNSYKDSYWHVRAIRAF
jgi:hypothetical protein